LLHPHDVVERLRRDRPGLVPDNWWQMFLDRLREVGAVRRPLSGTDDRYDSMRMSSPSSLTGLDDLVEKKVERAQETEKRANRTG
jgi:hypothetical protein